MICSILLSERFIFFHSVDEYYISSRLIICECQPLVPAVSAEDGQWLVTKPFAPVCKPGGHGVIWKLAYDKGIFKWFYDHGRKGATVRQVRYAVVSKFGTRNPLVSSINGG